MPRAGESDSEVLPVLLLLHKFCVSNATIYESNFHCVISIYLSPVPCLGVMRPVRDERTWTYPIAGAVRATFVDSVDAKSSGKL